MQRLVSYRLLSYAMVLYGMVGHGSVWYGMARYGIVRFGTYGTRYMAWHGRGMSTRAHADRKKVATASRKNLA